MKNNTSPWLGFLAGVAVGAGLYAFLTSAEGKAWLEKLRQAASAFRDDLEAAMANPATEQEEED
ncbi:MAG: YtxH domain-containing protein [Chitinophagaceae bacterium]|jgi:hypothetical protein|nr:YtxH domain-containing protein [Chitinophagaceae bacterium]